MLETQFLSESVFKLCHVCTKHAFLGCAADLSVTSMNHFPESSLLTAYSTKFVLSKCFISTSCLCRWARFFGVTYTCTIPGPLLHLPLRHTWGYYPWRRPQGRSTVALPAAPSLCASSTPQTAEPCLKKAQIPVMKPPLSSNLSSSAVLYSLRRMIMQMSIAMMAPVPRPAAATAPVALQSPLWSQWQTLTLITDRLDRGGFPESDTMMGISYMPASR